MQYDYSVNGAKHKGCAQTESESTQSPLSGLWNQFKLLAIIRGSTSKKSEWSSFTLMVVIN